MDKWDSRNFYENNDIKVDWWICPWGGSLIGKWNEMFIWVGPTDIEKEASYEVVGVWSFESHGVVVYKCLKIVHE